MALLMDENFLIKQYQSYVHIYSYIEIHRQSPFYQSIVFIYDFIFGNIYLTDT
jgi:hypothetical protein